MTSIDQYLKKMIEMKASDLFITAAAPVCVKVHGEIVEIGSEPLTPEQSKSLVVGIMNPDQKEHFFDKQESNFAIQREDLGRFRVSCFFQRSSIGAVLRRIHSEIPTVEELSLPARLNEFATLKRGLVLVVGATGTGKSTTLASLLQYHNFNKCSHIVTIEDPIEYIHNHNKSLITQREVGVDTESYPTALKNTLRQAPDVILIGEIRTPETMKYAIQFSETGHLCLATLHANNANQALDRIINFFPTDKHNQIFSDLSLNLQAIIGQQLIPKKSGDGRVPAIEILTATPSVKECIREGNVHMLKDYMSRGNEYGMCTFDDSLFDLYISDKIDYQNALRHADSQNDLRLKIKLQKGVLGEGELKDTELEE